MDLIYWRDSYNVGNQRVDEQHKYLVKLINDLFQALGSKDANEKLKVIFIELVNYTINHFTMEESLMTAAKYSEIVPHKAEHLYFINKIKELKDKFNKGDNQAKLETLNFLKDWLLTHISCIDKKAFDEINKVR
jgi:hemerythrin-like metal-binding protein